VVQVSEDTTAWVSLGSLSDGTMLLYDSFDLADAGLAAVQYVRIVKTGSLSRFIDAVFVPVSVYGAFAEDTDDEYPDGCVDWVAKQADDGQNALGEPDYDDSTPDIGNCSGWMVEAGRLTIGFEKPFFDGQGDDLYVYHFGRGGADVEISADGQSWTSLGELPAGINGGSRLDAAGYDLADTDLEAVWYVRINKTQVGYTYGRFIDAVEGVYGIPGTTGAAGRDQTVVEGAAVTLGADDDDETATYLWQQLEGSSVSLSDTGARNPQFIAPMVDGQTMTLRFKVTRSDADGDEEDEVKITVVDNGFTLTAVQEAIFTDAEFVFNNSVGADFADQDACYMGLACDGGTLIAYEAQDPDSELSSDYIDDFDDRPKNLCYGLVTFGAVVEAAGDTAAVQIFLPKAAPEGYRWYKYSPALGWIDFSRDTISDSAGDGAEFNEDRTVITVYITDGGPYDDDGQVDGYIQDPSGLADSTTVGSWNDEGGGGCFIGSLLGRKN
jgi:hypothetical protein